MRTFFVLIGLLCVMNSSHARSQIEPPLIEGLFQFGGHFSIESQRHYVLLDLREAGAADRLRELEAKFYTCFQQQGPERLCVKTVPVNPLDERVLEWVDEHHGQAEVEFSTPFTTHLEIDSESFRQWSVEQKVRLTKKASTRIFSRTRYTWSKGVQMVYPGPEENQRHEFFVLQGQGLLVPETLTFSIRDNEMDQFFLKLPYSRVSR